MRNFSLFISLPLIILLFSCESSNGPIESDITLLPLSTGNYWIYERTPIDSLGNSIGAPLYDTLMVTDKKTIDGKESYGIIFYRKNFVPSKAYVSNSGTGIRIYGHSFLPIFPLDTTTCWSRLPETWKDLTKNSFNKWKYRDSITFTTVGFVLDQMVIVTEAEIVNTEIIFAKEYQTEFENETRNVLQFDYTCQRFFRYLTPDKVVFPESPRYKIYEKGRVSLADDIKLSITYADKIGIIEFYEDFAYSYHPIRYKSKLIKYLLN